MTQDLAALAAALRTQRQIDMDGCEVAVSRQACDAAADALEAQAALDARINAAREEGLRLAAKICTRGDDRAAILAKIKEAENG